MLELYDKLQSHAYPAKWLSENRKAWENLDGGFDDTPYARELLDMVRRQAAHWSALLRQGAGRTKGDEALSAGYGSKFLIAAQGFRELSESGGWEIARQRAEMIDFPRLTTPKGRKDDPAVTALKQIWDGAKAAMKKLDGILDISGEEAMEDLRAVAPAMVALLDLTVDFGEAYRVEKLRLNAADFSDQEHLALRLLVA